MGRLTYLLIASATVLTGCRSDPLYCPGAPLDNCNLRIDAQPSCSRDTQCSGALAVCDLSTSTCVQCTTAEAAACSGATPACISDACHACTTHSQCASGACLPDGSCGNDTNVAYVDPGGGDNAMCTKQMPCPKVVGALATHRPFVKFHGTTTEAVSLNNQSVTLLADPGAELTTNKPGIILKIDGTSNVAVYDLTITGGLGPTGTGISMQPGNAANVSLVRATVSGNAGGGISATGGTLTVSQSTISANIPGGGLSATNGVLVLVGNVIFNNGGNASLVGGLSIGTTTNAMNRVEFNTIVLNTAQDGTGSGIHCLAGTFTAKDNIIADNHNPTLTTQIDGTCMHAYSLVRPGALPAGTGNIGDDPKFVNEAMGDLHLQATSTARGKADPSADLTGIAAHDIDGDTRVAPADLGADQVKS